jgi:hypothetical protein
MHRQRPQKERIHHAENCRVRADSQGQGGHGHRVVNAGDLRNMRQNSRQYQLPTGGIQLTTLHLGPPG